MQNLGSLRITTPSPAQFEPLIPAERQAQLVALLDARGGSQRGKPRSKDPTRNPLGSRVFDRNCTWPLYRIPYQDRFRYCGGQYMQSHGQKCVYNHIDGPTAVRFVFSCVRQRILAPHMLSRLEIRLRELAQQEVVGGLGAEELRSKEAALVTVKSQLQTVSQNLGLAKTPELFEVVAAQFEKLKAQEKALEAETTALRQKVGQVMNPEAEVAAAMRLLRHLTAWAAQAEDYVAVGELFRQLNVKLYALPGGAGEETDTEQAGGWRGDLRDQSPAGGPQQRADGPPETDKPGGTECRRAG